MQRGDAFSRPSCAKLHSWEFLQIFPQKNQPFLRPLNHILLLLQSTLSDMNPKSFFKDASSHGEFDFHTIITSLCSIMWYIMKAEQVYMAEQRQPEKNRSQNNSLGLYAHMKVALK